MAPHTSLRRQSSDCKIGFNLSPGPREVSAVVGKPQETTTKAEGLPSETVVAELPAQIHSYFVFYYSLYSSRRRNWGIIFICAVFSCECRLGPDCL